MIARGPVASQEAINTGKPAAETSGYVGSDAVRLPWDGGPGPPEPSCRLNRDGTRRKDRPAIPGPM
jgi:hypothetical protein